MKICPGEVKKVSTIDYYRLAIGTVFRGKLTAKAAESTFLKGVWGISDCSYVIDLVSGTISECTHDLTVLEIYPDACLKLKG